VNPSGIGTTPLAVMQTVGAVCNLSTEPPDSPPPPPPPPPPALAGKYKYPEFDPLVTTMGAALAPAATSAAAARAHS